MVDMDLPGERVFLCDLAGRGGNFTQNIPVLERYHFQPTDISQTYNAAKTASTAGLMSYFGRINYDFDNRAYVSFSIRETVVQILAPNNKFRRFSLRICLPGASHRNHS